MHEAGAIECTGHKVLALPEHSGKIDPGELEELLRKFYQDESYEHMVFPGMVYVSHPTEYGTLYQKKELARIGEICRKYRMPLFLDGARLGYGRGSSGISEPKCAQAFSHRGKAAWGSVGEGAAVGNTV